MKDITPARFRCVANLVSCPAVHEMDDGRLVVIGKRIDWQSYKFNVGPDEEAIVIDPAMLENVKR